MKEKNVTQKFFKVLENLILKNESTAEGLTYEDLLVLEAKAKNLQNLLSYENILKDVKESDLREAFVNEKFEVDKILINSKDYQELIKNHREINKLKNGESFRVKSVTVDEEHPIRYREYKRQDNFIVINYLCDPIPKREDIEKVSQCMLSQKFNLLKKSIEDGECGDETCEIIDNNTIKLADIEIGTVFLKKDKYQAKEVFRYTIPFKNMFEEKQFILLDEEGNRKDLITMKHFDALLRKIRNFNAHQKPFEFNTNTDFAGQMSFLEDGTTAVYSSNWIQSFYRAMDNRKSAMRKVFYQLHMPKRKSEIKNENELYEYLKECSIVKLSTKEECSLYEMEQYLDKYVRDYENIQNPKLSLRQYIDKAMLKDGIEGNVKENPFHKPELLFARLKQTPIFYKLDVNKKNIAAQKSVILELFNEVYQYEILDDKNILNNGKFLPLDINPHMLTRLINRNLDELTELLKEKDQNAVLKNRSSAFKSEHYVSLSIMCAYAHLVDNGFYESIREYESKYMKENNDKLRQYLRSQLNVTNMNSFTFRECGKSGKATERKVVTTQDKLLLLRVVRNAILHGNIKLRLNKGQNCADNELYFIYYPSDKKIAKFEIRIRVEDLYKFFMQPLFAEFEGKNMQPITLLEEDSVAKIIEENHPSYSKLEKKMRKMKAIIDANKKNNEQNKNPKKHSKKRNMDEDSDSDLYFNI